MQIHRRSGVLAVAALLVLTTACTEGSASPDADDVDDREDAGEFSEITGDINVVMVAPETGPLAATVGSALATGAQTMVELWNEQHPDRQAVLTVCNDEGNPERAIACVNRHVPDADVMIGPLFGSVYNAARDLLGHDQIAVTFTPHALPDPATNVFQASTPAELAMERTVAYFEEQGWDRFGLITSTDATGTSARADALEAAEEAGLEVVDQQFDPTSQDLTAQATAVADADVDAVFIWSSGAQVVTALRGLNRAGADIPVVLNFSSMSYDLMELAADVLPNDLLFTGSVAFDTAEVDDPERRALIEEFTERYESSAGVAPDWIGYAAGDMYLVALTAALHGDDVDSMSAYLEQSEPILGFHAVWDYSSDDHVGATSEAADSPIRIQRWNGEGWESAEQ